MPVSTEIKKVFSAARILGSGDDRVTLDFTAHAGFYDLAIRYRSPVKGFLFEVNGLTCSGKFADSHGAFTEQRFGKVELREGTNTLAIHGGWTHYEIDRVDLSPVDALPALQKPPATLCDPQSAPAARALMAFSRSNTGSTRCQARSRGRTSIT